MSYIEALIRLVVTVVLACIIGLALAALPTWGTIAGVALMVGLAVYVDGRSA